MHIDVQTPQDLTSEQVELLRKFAEMRGESLAEGSQSPLDHGFMSRIKDAFR